MAWVGRSGHTTKRDLSEASRNGSERRASRERAAGPQRGPDRVSRVVVCRLRSDHVNRRLDTGHRQPLLQQSPQLLRGRRRTAVRGMPHRGHIVAEGCGCEIGQRSWAEKTLAYTNPGISKTATDVNWHVKGIQWRVSSRLIALSNTTS